MGRLFLVAALALIILAIVALALSIWNAASAARAGRTPGPWGPDKDYGMAPTGLQKVAFAALIVLLLGISLGWLGGL
ncbi:MAG: hypothetical protein P1U53_14175 [Sulfitobacter sp.]|nr:hypothetical protein [Sulfitobacter sp.]